MNNDSGVQNVTVKQDGQIQEIIDRHTAEITDHEVRLSEAEVSISDNKSRLDQHEVIVVLVDEISTMIRVGLRWVKAIGVVLGMIASLLGIVIAVGALT